MTKSKAGPRPPKARSSKRQAQRGNRRGNSGSHKNSARTVAGAETLYLHGIHTVRAALENHDRKKLKLFATQNALSRLEETLENIESLDVEVTTAQALDKMVSTDSVHQGAVLQCLPLDALDSSELFHLADAKLIVMLDQITDPHNLGAILRSACALGADAVITTTRNSAPETAILAKTASGALDQVKLIHLKNLSKGLAELNDMGFFSFGLDSSGPLIVEETLEKADPAKITLVLGAENKGLREKTRETCNALARLDMPGPIKSLNVSNAAILSLYLAHMHLRKKLFS